MGGRSGVLACVAFDDDRPRHHVFGYARTHRTVDDDIGSVVHAGTIISDGTIDIYRKASRYADRHSMMAARVHYVEVDVVISLFDPVQGAIELPQGADRQVERRHCLSNPREWAEARGQSSQAAAGCSQK